jgi:hypothetical protein
MPWWRWERVDLFGTPEKAGVRLLDFSEFRLSPE